MQRAVHKGLGWPLPEDLDEVGLEALLFRQAAACEQYEPPDFASIHQELKRKGVTLSVSTNLCTPASKPTPDFS